MTADIYADVTVESEERFTELLTGLLVAADEDGIDVEGAWECENETDEHDWEATIVQLASKDD
jgi:hypothetical protein